MTLSLGMGNSSQKTHSADFIFDTFVEIIFVSTYLYLLQFLPSLLIEFVCVWGGDTGSPNCTGFWRPGPQPVLRRTRSPPTLRLSASVSLARTQTCGRPRAHTRPGFQSTGDITGGCPETGVSPMAPENTHKRTHLAVEGLPAAGRRAGGLEAGGRMSARGA